jgi:hypothetical protein
VTQLAVKGSRERVGAEHEARVEWTPEAGWQHGSDWMRELVGAPAGGFLARDGGGGSDGVVLAIVCDGQAGTELSDAQEGVGAEGELGGVEAGRPFVADVELFIGGIPQATGGRAEGVNEVAEGVGGGVGVFVLFSGFDGEQVARADRAAMHESDAASEFFEDWSEFRLGANVQVNVQEVGDVLHGDDGVLKVSEKGKQLWIQTGTDCCFLGQRRTAIAGFQTWASCRWSVRANLAITPTWRLSQELRLRLQRDPCRSAQQGIAPLRSGGRLPRT